MSVVQAVIIDSHSVDTLLVQVDAITMKMLVLPAMVSISTSQPWHFLIHVHVTQKL